MIMAAGSTPPTLPPSVEEAYKKKCIELRQRMSEVEESNNAYRLRKVRLMRGIRKMRLERAFLLDILGKRMKKRGRGMNGGPEFYDEDSEDSSDAPPTPHEKPLRSKRSHRRPLPSPPQSLAHHLSIPNHSSHPHNNQPGQQMFQSRRGHDAQSVANTNGNTNTTIELPPNMDHGSLQEPRPAFDEFVYANFLDHPERHPDCDNQADLVNLARHTWKNMDAAEKEPWKSRYARDYKAYSERLEAVNQRIIEHQASRAEPRPEEQEAQVGSGGGFTAVNS